MELKLLHHSQSISPPYAALSTSHHSSWHIQISMRNLRIPMLPLKLISWKSPPPPSSSSSSAAAAAAVGSVPRSLSISAALQPLDLTEDNVKRVLSDSRIEFAQIFDTEVGMTGEVELAELDGPFVKISLRGRFWHERSLVVARVGNYLKQRIPEILEVEIEDEKQLDDSPENF